MLAIFLALYGALLVAGLGLGVAITFERGITATAVAAMSLLSGAPVERTVSVQQEGGKVLYTIRVAIDSEVREGTLSHPFHSHNLLLFGALVLGTPGLARRQRAIALGSGLALIFLLDVTIAMGDIWTAENRNLQIDARVGVTRGLSQVGYLLRYMHPTGGAFMAPIFVWAFALVGPLRKSVMRALFEPGGATAGRTRK